MKTLVKWLFKPVQKRYQDLCNRILELEKKTSCLETVIECLIKSPEYIESEDIGFNGQINRKNIFLELLEVFDFDVIVETGTWIGNTTGFMAEKSKLPVYTVELVKLFYEIAQKRLKDFNNITFNQCDSREFLRKISNTDITNKNTFIYLDSHWYENLPLEEEVNIISGNWKNFVLMIDDFQVPGDDGYGHDDYGDGKSLTLETFSNIFSRNDLITFFPSRPSDRESGFKRGCVVLVKKGVVAQKIANVQSLAGNNNKIL